MNTKWKKIAAHTFTNDKGDVIWLEDNATAIINGIRIKGRFAIHAKRQELERR